MRSASLPVLVLSLLACRADGKESKALTVPQARMITLSQESHLRIHDPKAAMVDLRLRFDLVSQLLSLFRAGEGE